MDRKTKKMVEIETQIKSLIDKRDEINKIADDLNNYQPTFEQAKKARGDALDQLIHERNTINQDVDKLKIDLELATVEMLTRKDTDFADPTPADALRNAS